MTGERDLSDFAILIGASRIWMSMFGDGGRCMFRFGLYCYPDFGYASIVFRLVPQARARGAHLVQEKM